MTTLSEARKGGAGSRLTDGETTYEVSDWSPATGEVYGWPLTIHKGYYPWSWGAGDRVRRGAYGKLPEGLTK